jgi:hypothetical protein
MRSRINIPWGTGGGGGAAEGGAGLSGGSPQAFALLSFEPVVLPVACLFKNGFVLVTFGLKASCELLCEFERDGGPALNDSSSPRGGFMVSAARPGLSRASSPSPLQTFALPASESVADRSSPRASCIENGLGASVEIGVTGYGGEVVGARLEFPC